MYSVEVYQAGIHLLSIIALFGLSVILFVLGFIYPGKIQKNLIDNTTYREPSGYSFFCVVFCVINAANIVGFFSCTLLKALVKLGYLV